MTASTTSGSAAPDQVAGRTVAELRRGSGLGARGGQMTAPGSDPESRRLTPTERLHEVTMAAMSRQGRLPSFGVTEERAPGGIVLPLFRCEVPVCDEFPTADEAFAAMTGYLAAFREAHPGPAVNGGTE